MAGRKQWAPFERLNAADVNSYLADQSVMRFATAAARDAAIPLPEPGMMVARADNGGKPEYWDGNAWTLVTAGSQVQQLLTRIDPMALGVLRVNNASLTGGVWVEVTPGLADPIMIYGFFHRANAAAVIEIATGPSGSEKIRLRTGMTSSVQSGSEGQYPITYGLFVPANTRLVYRSIDGTGPSSSYLRLDYAKFPVDGVTAEFAHVNKTLPTTPTSAWQEVAAAPPIATGAYIVGVNSNRALDLNHTFQLAFGAAGAETPVTAPFYVTSTDQGYGSESKLPPILWPANTRLSFKTTHQNTNTPTITFMLRSHLT